MRAPGGGPPRGDVQPDFPRFQLPRRWIGPSLPFLGIFLLWKVAPGALEGTGTWGGCAPLHGRKRNRERQPPRGQIA